MRIYLADLTYDTVKTNFTVPLNVGYLAAMLDQKLGNAVDIRLFKYPRELEAALKESPPDVLGLSNYSWNSMLNLVFMRLFRRCNPDGITLMGGPHVRRGKVGLESFLREHTEVDYYIPGEGEYSTLHLIKGLLGGGDGYPATTGAATIKNGHFQYEEDLFSAGPKELDIPSPYLTGWLDPFLKDPNMIPLFESNRGCPFKCAFCTWGNRINARVKIRNMDIICEEIEYIAKHSAGQVGWSICDANFGILPRDIEIAEVFRKTIDKYGYPNYLDLCHSKNTTARNIKIAEILGPANNPMIGLQSADPVVLEKMGRKNISFDSIHEQIGHYHSVGSKVSTDILIGMAGETKQSHLETLSKAFSMGFDYICAINIRMLPGSVLETPEFREKHKIKTKYRPILGAYGVYDDQLVVEYEEGLRATASMTEEELNSFKVHHLLMYIVWASGMFRAQLKLGQKFGINPMTTIHQLAETEHPKLRPLFDNLLKESAEEWFDDKESFLKYYSDIAHLDELENFMRLNSKYIACMISDPAAIEALRTEFRALLDRELLQAGEVDTDFAAEVFTFTDSLWCNDLLSPAHEEIRDFSGKVAALVLDRPELAEYETITVRIYRSEETVNFCKFHLAPDGKPDLSIYNLARFQEIGGISRMLYATQIIAPEAVATKNTNEKDS